MKKQFIASSIAIALIVLLSTAVYANTIGERKEAIGETGFPRSSANNLQETPQLTDAQRALMEAELAKYTNLTDEQKAKIEALLAQDAQIEARYGFSMTDEQIKSCIEYYVEAIVREDERRAELNAQVEKDMMEYPNSGPYIPDPNYVFEGKEILDAYAEAVQEELRAYRKIEKEAEQILKKLYRIDISIIPWGYDMETGLLHYDKECVRLAAQAINTLELSNHEKWVLRAYIEWNMNKELFLEPFIDDLLKALYS